MTLNGHPLYSQIIERMKSGDSLLDLGCCFGQDLRQLVADGAPSEKIYGLDIESRLIDMGYDLFMDRGKLNSTFVVEDVYNPEADWSQLEGKMDIINASAFFHLFPWPKQIEAGCLLVRFGRPKAGTIIVGRQTGSLTPAEFPGLSEGTTAFRHDLQTLQRLWDEVGAITDTHWKASGTLDTVSLMGKGDSPKDSKNEPEWAEPNTRRLLFTIERL